MRVRPTKPGVLLRDPHTKMPLPSEGGDVPENSYWLRRLRDGDVERVGDSLPTGLEPVTPLTTRGDA